MPHTRQPLCRLNRDGFGLVEMVACVAILGLLLSLAAPAFGRWLREAEMSRAINSLVADIHRARQTAQVRARTVTLCASSSGLVCEDRLDWSDGWLVAPAGATEVSGVPALSQVAGHRAVGIRIVANRRAFEFRPFTLRDTNGSLWFCDLRGKARPRRLVISPTGRPRLAFEQTLNPRLSCEA
ncbi:MAG: GspH/FimT family pseudopilin [Gammaproteobacteria bacterium]|nr:GspH/FimT family pseudopilin [Gammaproteobacteria bacterium]